MTKDKKKPKKTNKDTTKKVHLPSNSSILSGGFKNVNPLDSKPSRFKFNEETDEKHQKKVIEKKHQPSQSNCSCLNCNVYIVTPILVAIIAILVYRERIGRYVSPIAQRYIPENLSNIDFTPWDLKSVVGAKMAQKGYKAHFPVIGIPGYITTALELWKGKPCMGNMFRTKIWGGPRMLSLLASDLKCWIEHMKLGVDGGDPEGIRLRPLRGLESVDYVMPGYWVWARIILELGEIGYDANNLSVESYDWRLGFDQLEKRDGYFTKLKRNIEFQVQFHHKKVVIVSHSLGSLVWYYFMKWVEDKHHGRGGPKWIDKHVEHFVNIGGPMLGVAKAATALVSGEMRDTAAFLMQGWLEKIITIEQRADLFRSWGSIYHMLPKGGNKFWKSLIDIKDDQVVTGDTMKEFLTRHGDQRMKKHLSRLSFGSNLNVSHIHSQDSRYWSNPLASRLPNAPNLKIHCFYGYNIPTETGYHYKKDEKLHLDFDVTDIEKNTTFGVVETLDGDGTVTLDSLGWICNQGWKNELLNPYRIKVVTKEFPHEPTPMFDDGGFHLRGGGKSADHVDIMGNEPMIRDLLKIASGNYQKIKPKMYSKFKN